MTKKKQAGATPRQYDAAFKAEAVRLWHSSDLQVTRLLPEASRNVDIALLDHVLLGRPECDPVNVGYYSFRSAGLL